MSTLPQPIDPALDPRAVATAPTHAASDPTAFRETAPNQVRWAPRVLRLLQPLFGLAGAAAVWWALTTPLLHRGSMATSFSPALALPALWDLVRRGAILPHLLASLQRVGVGLLCAAAVGIPLGVALGLRRGLERSTSLVFQMLRMISPLSWMPIAVMALGVGELPVYFLLATAAVWPIALNTTAGVHAVDPRWLRLGRSLCATRAEVVRHVVLPAVLAHVVTGLRLAVGITWLVLVPAEMLGVSSGLGYAILDARDRLAYPELTAVILVIGAVGFVLDTVLRVMQQ